MYFSYLIPEQVMDPPADNSDSGPEQNCKNAQSHSGSDLSEHSQQDGHDSLSHGEGDKNAQSQLSKKQLKKMQKREKWQQQKLQKRKEQREKEKMRKKMLKSEQPEHKRQKESEEQGELKSEHTKRRKQQYKQKMLDGLKVIIDLQFYDLMTEKQLNSLAKQLSYCHSVNRKAQKCFNYILTSVTEPRLKFLDSKYNISNYGINITQQDLLQAFSPQSLVYLTGDAEEELTEFNPNEIYIIGGIVDHNRLKNITIDYANKHGLRAKRLPMDNVRLKASVHLAVNHVWEWMLRAYNGESWGDAIKAVIPERKLQQTHQQQ